MLKLIIIISENFVPVCLGLVIVLSVVDNYVVKH